MMWESYSNLADIHKILSDIFEKNMRMNERVYNIIDLSFDEYMTIVDRLRTADAMSTIQHFSLCIFVAWVTAYRLGRQDNFYKLIKDFISHLPQHQSRLALDEINIACFDYQIDTFGRSINSVRDIKRLAKIHAGLVEPDESNFFI